jgi:anti-sigma-K factor RskA
VYQLWAIMDDGRVISVALLDAGGDTAAFRVSPDGLAGFAVTMEVDGGVVTSTQDAVAVGLVDA